ncbi:MULTISPECIES: retropepsin-like aspartic protease family protein [Deefgea]|uniref:TIGR02281 family clan AA aspartic protease n=1 Tax=Deefgea chitinilytica TaxID=570276 RepID=A0ABS2C805_9NEIS|nr:MULTISPECIES: retropepsin-like aspartic protease [Deefgea]MBM5570279.1 TIGR02281 family clan AA aspartic protease [Deefgea chitinilytica]MBM9887508.1 clan AA aspartic protease [Deefgea sp. CFH1-16]
MLAKTLKTCLLALLISSAAHADEITLLATMGSKAIFQVNGQKKTLQIGQTVGSAKIISIAADSAVIENSNGRQRRLGLGEGYIASTQTQSDGDSSLVLSPSYGGHYLADISINGQTQRGVIDTGATHLSMSSKAADQLNIKYRNGKPMRSQTANGVINSWLVQIPQLRIGTVTLYNIDLSVRDSSDTGPVLIGMSTLNRFQMKREQDLMILSKKAY